MIYPITPHEIASMRAYRRWTQAELARLVDVRPDAVHRWESGAVTPYPKTRRKLWQLANQLRREVGEDELPEQDDNE